MHTSIWWTKKQRKKPVKLYFHFRWQSFLLLSFKVSINEASFDSCCKGPSLPPAKCLPPLCYLLILFFFAVFKGFGSFWLWASYACLSNETLLKPIYFCRKTGHIQEYISLSEKTQTLRISSFSKEADIVQNHYRRDKLTPQSSNQKPIFVKFYGIMT